MKIRPYEKLYPLNRGILLSLLLLFFTATTFANDGSDAEEIDSVITEQTEIDETDPDGLLDMSLIELMDIELDVQVLALNIFCAHNSMRDLDYQIF